MANNKMKRNNGKTKAIANGNKIKLKAPEAIQSASGAFFMFKYEIHSIDCSITFSHAFECDFSQKHLSNCHAINRACIA